MHPDYGAHHHTGKHNDPIDVAGFMQDNMRLFLGDIFEGIVNIDITCRQIPGLRYGISGGCPVKLFPHGTYEVEGGLDSGFDAGSCAHQEERKDFIVVDCLALRHLMDITLCCTRNVQLEFLWEHVFIGMRLAYQHFWLSSHKYDLVRISKCPSAEVTHKGDIAFAVMHALRVWREIRKTGQFDRSALADALVTKSSDIEQSYADRCIEEYVYTIRARTCVFN